VAKANKLASNERVELVTVPKWWTPGRAHTKNPFRVSLRTKADLLLAIGTGDAEGGRELRQHQPLRGGGGQYFASTDRQRVSQLLTRVWPAFTVTVGDKRPPLPRPRLARHPAGTGWEYIDGYPLVAEATLAAEQCKEKLLAKSVAPGKKDWCSAPSTLAHHPRVGRASDGARPRAGLRGQLRRHLFVTTTSWASCSTAPS